MGCRLPLPVLLWLAVSLAAPPAVAGLALREQQSLQREGEEVAVTQVVEVLADGDICRINEERSDEPVGPPGSFLLVTVNDVWLVDPARSEFAPFKPTRLQPAAASVAASDISVTFRDVDLRLEVDEPGPVVLGRRTRRQVYRLAFVEERSATGDREGLVIRHEQRHELWVAPWPPGVEAVAWRHWRQLEDGGSAATELAVREALDRMQSAGLALRQSIERRATEAPGGAVWVERLQREVLTLEQREFAAGFFTLPAGYTPTELLAPPPTEDG
jgi:hypothetical protein